MKPLACLHSPQHLRRSECVDVETKKVSIYLPAEVLAEMFAEAERLQRSFSWVVREAVKIALPKLKGAP